MSADWIADADAALSAAPVRSLPPRQVCGNCQHGEQDRELIACTLGWAAHEKPVSSHPGVPVPLLAPQTGCMCLKASWKLVRA
ncbi:hypothetical protein [Deinococcus sp.]|uniref:hypothetical protein n=1 Tax=Deinococcus sp. TaxID=47478 RepID=UPI0025D13D15|nr:hypothetical protein [Deinococcus sp.]